MFEVPRILAPPKRNRHSMWKFDRDRVMKAWLLPASL